MCDFSLTVLLPEVTASPKGNPENPFIPSSGLGCGGAGGFWDEVWRVDKCPGHSQVVLGQLGGRAGERNESPLFP